MDGVIIGRGSYSRVFREGDTAIKLISNDHFDSAVREILFTKLCEHPNVISLLKFEFVSTEIKLYMKYYEYDLHTYTKNTILHPFVVFSIAKDLISAVNHIHHNNIIHGDLKPANILFDGVNAVVSDFGIAVIEEELHHDSLIQTCTYRAPEIDTTVRLNKFNGKIDIWSVGCILLELVTGKQTMPYIAGTEDSSVYATIFYELEMHKSRHMRINSLLNLSKEYKSSIIMKKIDNTKPRNIALIDSGIMQLIIACLDPDPVIRISSDSALAAIKKINDKKSRTDETIPSGIVNRRRSIDDIECAVKLHHNIITHGIDACLKLANIIFNNYVNITTYSGVEDRCACVYLAICIFSGSASAIEPYTKKYTIQQLREYATKILVTIDGKLI